MRDRHVDETSMPADISFLIAFTTFVSKFTFVKSVIMLTLDDNSSGLMFKRVHFLSYKQKSSSLDNKKVCKKRTRVTTKIFEMASAPDKLLTKKSIDSAPHRMPPSLFALTQIIPVFIDNIKINWLMYSSSETEVWPELQLQSNNYLLPWYIRIKIRHYV